MATYVFKIGHMEWSTDAETFAEAMEKAYAIFLGNPDYYRIEAVIPHDFNEYEAR